MAQTILYFCSQEYAGLTEDVHAGGRPAPLHIMHRMCADGGSKNAGAASSTRKGVEERGEDGGKKKNAAKTYASACAEGLLGSAASDTAHTSSSSTVRWTSMAT